MSESRHLYDYQVMPGSVGAIVPRMIDAGARVLELGTGPGAITKQLHANGCRVVGMEIDPTAIPLVEPYCERVIQADLNAQGWEAVLGHERFDAVVMTDVLEHLYDPWRTLAAAVTLMKPGGSLVISLPHVAHSAILAGLLHERFDYQPWGLLDRTHIRFFGLRNMQELIHGVGLRIVDADFVVKRPEDTEFEGLWKTLPEATRDALSSNPHGQVYQAVIKSMALSAAPRQLDLLEVALPAPAPGKFGGNPPARFLLGFISLKNRQRIANLLRGLGIKV